MDSCTARAPCSTANLGPGFDVFGLALDALEDRVTVTRKAQPGISVSVIGTDFVPSNVESNSAGRVVKKMAEDFAITEGIEIRVQKGIPAGYGLGSSGASSAAAALAFERLFDIGIEKDMLVRYAAEGELASAGSRHYDNVSASLLGEFVITRVYAHSGPEFTRMKAPDDLCLVVGVPDIAPPQRKTELARSVLPRLVPLESVVHNVSAASTIVAGFAKGDVSLIASGVDDVIVEPARKAGIKGYSEVRGRALKAGALAVTISGAGPSLLCILKSREKSQSVSEAVKEGFGEVGLKCSTFQCRSSPGAQLV